MISTGFITWTTVKQDNLLISLSSVYLRTYAATSYIAAMVRYATDAAGEMFRNISQLLNAP